MCTVRAIACEQKTHIAARCPHDMRSRDPLALAQDFHGPLPLQQTTRGGTMGREKGRRSKTWKHAVENCTVDTLIAVLMMRLGRQSSEEANSEDVLRKDEACAV